MRIILWEEPYALATLARVPPPDALGTAAGPPIALVVGNGEISLLAPEAVIEAVGAEHVIAGWRALTLDAVMSPEQVGVLAEISRVLALVGVPLMAFSSHDTDHFLVPAPLLGRALAALNQSALTVE